jgi:hypothetical protein
MPFTGADHAAPADAGSPPGSYRVGGTVGGAVTLLRVADADGRL